MDANDVLFDALTADQQLLLVARMLVGELPAAESPTVASEDPKLAQDEPEPKGWSKAQKTALDRFLWGQERYPSWIYDMITEQEHSEDIHTALREFASALLDEPHYDFRTHLGFGRWQEDELLPAEDQAPPQMAVCGLRIVWIA